MKTHLRILYLLIPLTLLISACLVTLPATSKGTATQGVSFQNSPDLLPDPTVGLAGLQNYHVSFQQDVTGLKDGKPFERHTNLDLARSAGQVDFTRQIQGTEEITSYFHAIQTDQAAYRWNSVNENCQGEAGPLLEGEVTEPALLLLPVLKTTKVGNETVNSIPAIHYHFDAAGLALASPKPSVTGEFWLAQAGGYVVRYKLNASGPATTTGAGMEVGQTMTYDLTPLDPGASIDLPAGCMAVPLDLPVMPDATSVTRSSGNVSYSTASSVAQVVDLYYQDLGSLGWTAALAKPTGGLKLPLGLTFQQGNLDLAVDVDTADSGGLDVDLVVYNPGEQAAAAAGTPSPAATVTPSGPLPTVNPSESGLPQDVPLYPGATSLQSLGGLGAEFTAPALPDQVAAFYREKMQAGGWTLVQEIANAGTTLQSWQKGQRIATLSISPKANQTDVMIVIATNP